MAKQVQFRRGTTAQLSSVTGVEGELFVDTTKDTITVHDGYQAGGRPLLREDLDNLADGAVGVAKLSHGSGNAGQVLKVNSAGNGIEIAGPDFSALTTSVGFPTGSTAQRSGTTAGALRYNNENDVLERYHEFPQHTAESGWYTSGEQLVARVHNDGGWTSMDIDWYQSGATRFAAYRVVGQVFESDNNPWDLRLRLKSGDGSVMSGNYYYGSGSFSAPNDGWDGAVGNQNPGAFACISTPTFAIGDTAYAMGVNGENSNSFEMILMSGIPGSNVHTKIMGQAIGYSQSYGSSSFKFGYLVASQMNPVTNGINTIGGIRIYPSAGTIKSTSNAAVVSVFGIPGYEIYGSGC